MYLYPLAKIVIYVQFFLSSSSMKLEDPFTPSICVNAATTAMVLVILFSLKTIEALENELQPHFGVTPLFSMSTLLLVTSKSFRSIDSDARCKTGPNNFEIWLQKNIGS